LQLPRSVADIGVQTEKLICIKNNTGMHYFTGTAYTPMPLDEDNYDYSDKKTNKEQSISFANTLRNVGLKLH